MKPKKKTILFAGGGTIGPVTPLLAIYEELKKRHPEFLYQWVGTVSGPERKLVAEKDLPFYTLPEVKIDRFLSLRNLIMPFRMIGACIKANKVLKQSGADFVITAGGYVAVPLFWMARLRGVSTHVHQLDVRPGLANKLMSPFAKSISVTFESSLKDFPVKKTKFTGAPVRSEIFQPSTDNLNFSIDRPTVFIFGGGTGAASLNELVWAGLEDLASTANIIHLTGQNKGDSRIKHEGYIQKDFLTTEMSEAYAKADLVVTRGGLGSLLELAALKKPAIIIPIPGSHQEDNAALLSKTNSAVVLDQMRMRPQIFAAEVIRVLKNKDLLNKLSENISQFYLSDSASKIVNQLEAFFEEDQPEKRIAADKTKPFNLKDVKRVHLVGIGGIGISYLAHFFLENDVLVSGSDLASSIVTDQLAQKGASLFKGHHASQVPADADLVIYNDAIPPDNPELVKAKELGIKMMTNFQVVGKLSKDYKTIVIAGNKGKTTTTAMLSTILEQAGCDPTAMVGSIVNDWKCNFRGGKSQYLVVEGDEYKEHFLEINADIAVITNMAPDHLDYYGTVDKLVEAFQKFIDALPDDGLLVINAGDEMTKQLNMPKCKILKFALGGEADLTVTNLSSAQQVQSFDVIKSGQELGRWQLHFPGAFNVANALAAATVALELGITPEQVSIGLENFHGTWRRFQILGAYKGAIMISDYAHHPTAVHATIQAAKDFYSGRRVVVVFQPHTRHRTKALFDDFVSAFDLADIVVIPNIYSVAGREVVTKEEMNANILVDAIKERGRSAEVIASGDLQETKNKLEQLIQPNDIVLMMGAGDIYRIAEDMV